MSATARPVIRAIEVRTAELPMARPFVHAGLHRSRTGSVLVRLVAQDVRGWGEGAPRPYVTGETVRGAADALGRVEPGALNGMIDFSRFPAAMLDLARADLTGLVGGPQSMPAAAAALEIALFDLICRLHDQDGLSGLRGVPWAAAVLNRAPSPAPVSYVLDLARDPAERMAELGDEAVGAIRHVKLKATADLDDCERRVRAVRASLAHGTPGPRSRPVPSISVDANGDWDRATAVRAARRLGPLGVTWLEEPVAARDWPAMREVREAGGMPVMLDESCTTLADLDAAVEERAADHVNIRISKCGGIFPALALVAAARARGLGVQLGVQVGEIGPLWAAGRLLACSLDGLVAVEAGKQDEWFPVPLTEPPYAVDRRRYLAPPLGGTGIGVVPAGNLTDQYPPESENVGVPS
jgi:L-alanine-DL-glutamate epimerase-like enolase superfamily enzyme